MKGLGDWAISKRLDVIVLRLKLTEMCNYSDGVVRPSIMKDMDMKRIDDELDYVRELIKGLE